jgi:hypothetical protein
MIEAQIIADSVSASTGRRLTTFLLTYNRYVHSELLTHRVFARNSASSRAIPVKTMLWNVWKNPAIPVRWGRTKKGMQDGGELPRSVAAMCRAIWLLARYPALLAAWLLVKLRLHKQVANRLLEPWCHMTVVLTGTEWKNFYKLRFHKDAQPEFKVLAEAMLRAHAASEPKVLQPGEWHLPFWRWEDEQRLKARIDYPSMPDEDELQARLSVCTARCARTSYVNFYGKDSFYDDTRLHDNLNKSGHMSPFEHCCRAEVEDRFFGHVRAFVPYRKLIAKETHDDGSLFDPKKLLEELADA